MAAQQLTLNGAVQALLRLSSRGEALVAEILRLSDHVPPLFVMADRVEQKMYGDVLLDFRYLKSPELFEHRIEVSTELQERDREVWEAHAPLVCRFFALFESVYTYAKDFAKCVQDLQDGVYIQQTVESVLADDDGKQLMCEVLYLFGVHLTLMDARIDGAVRERMVVAYYRNSGGATIEAIDEICLLVQSTGYSPTTIERNGMVRLPPGYPEDYFARMLDKLGIDRSIVKMMIARLRSEDMYSQVPSFPLPQHRSTALATQARMLYILLYFVPEVLEEEHHTMREIVDRHFADNWVITFYMGFVVELTYVWDTYKAARTALANTTKPETLRSLHASHLDHLVEAKKQLASTWN